jgi:hypothetical protein
MNPELIKNWKHNWFGLWQSEHHPYAPKIEDWIDETFRWSDTDHLLQYLDQAPVVAAFGTKFPCDLCNTDLPCVFHSDDVFDWDRRLIHEIQVHNVVLPERFVAHIRSLNYIPPIECHKRYEELNFHRRNNSN